MSIDATVTAVGIDKDGEPYLKLGPSGRGPHPNDPPGQNVLRVVNRPCPPLDGFIGCHVWGGANQLMIGETQVAKRIGYTRIELAEKKYGT